HLSREAKASSRSARSTTARASGRRVACGLRVGRGAGEHARARRAGEGRVCACARPYDFSRGGLHFLTGRRSPLWWARISHSMRIVPRRNPLPLITSSILFAVIAAGCAHKSPPPHDPTSSANGGAEVTAATGVEPAGGPTAARIEAAIDATPNLVRAE